MRHLALRLLDPPVHLLEGHPCAVLAALLIDGLHDLGEAHAFVEGRVGGDLAKCVRHTGTRVDRHWTIMLRQRELDCRVAPARLLCNSSCGHGVHPSCWLAQALVSRYTHGRRAGPEQG